jgi:hypothetical protein
MRLFEFEDTPQSRKSTNLSEGDVIDAEHRFGKFNRDSGTHGMIKRHVQFDIDELYPGVSFNSPQKKLFAEYFENKHIKLINSSLPSVPFKNVEWAEVNDVLFSPDLGEMEITYTVRPTDPTNMFWLHEVRAYLQKEARVAIGNFIRKNV